MCSASGFSLPLPADVQGQFSAEEHRFGIYAGDIETLMMLHPARASVRMEHAQNSRSTSQTTHECHAIQGNRKSANMG